MIREGSEHSEHSEHSENSENSEKSEKSEHSESWRKVVIFMGLGEDLVGKVASFRLYAL